MPTDDTRPDPLPPPEWWYHVAHGLHDHAHHLVHRALDLCVPLLDATPERRRALAAPEAAQRPCPWCGHPPMCHKGPEGECVREERHAD